MTAIPSYSSILIPGFFFSAVICFLVSELVPRSGFYIFVMFLFSFPTYPIGTVSTSSESGCQRDGGGRRSIARCAPPNIME